MKCSDCGRAFAPRGLVQIYRRREVMVVVTVTGGELCDACLENLLTGAEPETWPAAEPEPRFALGEPVSCLFGRKPKVGTVKRRWVTPAGWQYAVDFGDFFHDLPETDLTAGPDPMIPAPQFQVGDHVLPDACARAGQVTLVYRERDQWRYAVRLDRTDGMPPGFDKHFFEHQLWPVKREPT